MLQRTNRNILMKLNPSKEIDLIMWLSEELTGKSCSIEDAESLLSEYNQCETESI